MKSASTIVAVVLLLVGSIGAQTAVPLGGEVQVPIAQDWTLGSDTAQFPIQIVHQNRYAELIIFKSVLSADQAISNEQDLRTSVKKVVDNVILTLPEAKLLTNIGFYEGYRTGFILEFISTDTSSQITLRHRLEGILYRDSDGRQLLFTLWGKAALDRYPDLARAIKSMQNGFIYTGPYEAEVFAPARTGNWYLYLILLLMIALLLYTRFRRQRRHKNGADSETNSWTCECGRLNSGNMPTCLRCGHERVAAPIS